MRLRTLPLIAVLALAGCSSPRATETAPAPAEAESAQIGVWYEHTLYTHCGILGTRFDDRDWVADPPLHDGNGNPPPGWGNPGDEGRIRLLDEDSAQFQTSGGRTAFFRLREPNDPPPPLCD